MALPRSLFKRLAVVVLMTVATQASHAPPLRAAAPGNAPAQLALSALDVTNAERAKAGLQPVSFSDRLSQEAQVYSHVLATDGCFGHSCGPTPKLEDRVYEAGYNDAQLWGENVAAGFDNAEGVIAAWMDSPEHRANLLEPAFNEMGVGIVSGEGHYHIYWTMLMVNSARTAAAVRGGG